MKVKKIILIILLLATILLLACVTFYKFINTNNEEQKGEVKEDFISGNVSEIVKNPITSDLDKDKYAENIIKEAKKATEYNYFDNKESITGQIYIGDDKYLYITDTNKNSTHRVSTIKFKTMYVKEFNYTNGIYIALISEDNKIYCMELAGNDISKAIVVPAHTSIKEVTNFTNVNIKTDMFGDSTTMFVLSGDGNIYDVASSIDGDGFYIEKELVEGKIPSLKGYKDYYSRKIKVNGNKSLVDLNYKYTYDDYENSYILQRCFEKSYVKNTDDSLYVSLGGYFKCFKEDDIRVKVSTDYDVVKHNADIVTDDYYIWDIKLSEDVNDIELFISKEIKEEKDESFSTIRIIILVLFIILGIGLVLFKKNLKNK